MTTHKEKTQFVIKKIQRLVPDIMELKNGCKILTSDDPYILATFLNFKGNSEDECNVDFGDGTDYIKISDFVKILGRPVTKFDVEKAIEKIRDNYSELWEDYQEEDKFLYKYYNQDIENNLETQLKDNKELADFLYEIFKRNPK